MRNVKPLVLALGALAVAGSFTSEAQLFDKLKDKAGSLVKKSKKPAASTGGSATAASSSSAGSAGSPSLGTGPSDDLISFTSCTNLELTNVMTGELGDYTFKRGFSTEERSGMINRAPGSVNKTCILPSIKPRQVIYMEVDTDAYEAMGNSNDWEMQCVKSANPAEGAVGEKEPKSEYPYKVSYLSGKDVLLHCGHSVAHASSCAEGSNASRSTQYKKQLDSRGKTMLSVFGTTSSLAPANGEKLYCQYYNKPTGKSLFAFEYLRTRG